MENKLIVSLSPHVHGNDSVKKNMYGVLIALIPAFLVSLYFFGLGALIVTLTSVVACLFFEWAIGKFLMKKPTTTITDGSAIITGVLLAFNLPSNLPIWIIILGALFAIGVGKHDKRPREKAHHNRRKDKKHSLPIISLYEFFGGCALLVLFFIRPAAPRAHDIDG